MNFITEMNLRKSSNPAGRLQISERITESGPYMYLKEGNERIIVIQEVKRPTLGSRLDFSRVALNPRLSGTSGASGLESSELLHRTSTEDH